ncbi:efflux RND transporter periplasmic adaptor subunit [Pararhodobacter sp.]|uniref:efflux RND transporter periplasmic adaptor subunit n=1 Tax=Pararhodobacter sp. TaxID=2127056 RepID=UPI002AFF4CC8|nr:efflux RND transporter periplasmic adaptor subunit [Pararhodobacter sp.]
MSPQTMTPSKDTPSAAPAPGQKPDWAKSDRQLGRDLRIAAGQPVRRRVWPWVFGLVLVAGAGGYGYYATQMAPAAPVEVAATPAPALVLQINPDEVSVLAPQTLERRVRASGTVEPWRNTQLSSQAGGEVRAVAVRPGDTVDEGALLVQLDVETLTLDLNQAQSSEAATQAQLELALIQLERVRALVERGVTTSASLDEAQNTVTQTRANLDALQDQVASAQLRLRHATVRAPFAGIVASRSVEPGQYVGPGTPLVSIVDLRTVELRANAAVADGALLRQRQAVLVSVDGIERPPFEGVVSRINPVAQEGTRTVPVYITIDNPDGVLLGGMFATAQVVIDSVPDALALPTIALREDAEGPFVLRVVDDRLERAGVETGGTWTGGLTRITQGLAAGDRVITAPLSSLQPGDAVELVGR